MPFHWPWQRRPEPPAFYRNYLAHFAAPPPPTTPIEELRFVVFDTETTGLNPRRHRLLSIGALSCQHSTIAVGETFDLLLQTPDDARQTADAITVHGIVPGQQEALPEADAVALFLHYCRDAVLVGHHVAFDVAMINGALARLGAGPLKNAQVDTMHLARRVNPPREGTPPGHFNLDHLAREYHIPLSDRHTAAGDAYITAVLMLKLLARLRKRGVLTLRDLLR